MTRNRRFYMVIVLACVGVAGCGGSRSRTVRVATFSTLTTPQAAPDPKLIAQHCPFGAPRKLASLEHGPTQIVTHEGYVLEHDAASKIALWVCESLDPAFFVAHAVRRDPFKPDPTLNGKPRAELGDYKGSGFDRGHMTASADRLSTQALNDQTFFLTNMVPQNGSLNSGFWSRLEGEVRRFGEDGIVHDAKAITGGFFYDPAEEDPATADGLIPFEQIGPGSVAVPTHIFKVVVGRNAMNQLQAIAFVSENKRPPSGRSFAQTIVAIDWLEERAGLNFMPDLDPADENALESAPSPMWGP
jgi:endonuclease G, mitochondrial